MFRRRRKNRDADEETCKTLLKRKDGSISLGDKPKDLVQLHRIAHPTNGMKTRPPIPVGNFAAHLNSLKLNGGTFNREYVVKHHFIKQIYCLRFIDVMSTSKFTPLSFSPRVIARVSRFAIAAAFIGENLEATGCSSTIFFIICIHKFITVNYMLLRIGLN